MKTIRYFICCMSLGFLLIGWETVFCDSLKQNPALQNQKVESKPAKIILDVSKPIYVNQNSNIIAIRLPANQTTGYSWSLQKYDVSLIRLSNYQYVAPSTHLIGAPGYAQFTLQILPAAFAVSKKILLIFVYQRPWEKQAGKIQKVLIIPQNSNSLLMQSNFHA